MFLVNKALAAPNIVLGKKPSWVPEKATIHLDFQKMRFWAGEERDVSEIFSKATSQAVTAYSVDYRNGTIRKIPSPYGQGRLGTATLMHAGTNYSSADALEIAHWTGGYYDHGTNVLDCTNLTNWTTSNSTIAATGETIDPDVSYNAFRLTATSANGRLYKAPYNTGAYLQFGVAIKRVTGSGPILITGDNYVTTYDISSYVDTAPGKGWVWVHNGLCTSTGAATNYGIELSTSGDVVDIAYMAGTCASNYTYGPFGYWKKATGASDANYAGLGVSRPRLTARVLEGNVRPDFSGTYVDDTAVYGAFRTTFSIQQTSAPTANEIQFDVADSFGRAWIRFYSASSNYLNIQGTTPTLTLPPIQNRKQATRLKVGDYAVGVNGVSAVTSADATAFPTGLDRIEFTHDNYLKHGYKTWTYYPQYMTNAELLALSTR